METPSDDKGGASDQHIKGKQPASDDKSSSESDGDNNDGASDGVTIRCQSSQWLLIRFQMMTNKNYNRYAAGSCVLH